MEVRYGRGCKVRMVNAREFLNLNQRRIFVGNPFAGYHVGVKEFVDKASEVWLETIDEHTGLIELTSCILQINEKPRRCERMSLYITVTDVFGLYP